MYSKPLCFEKMGWMLKSRAFKEQVFVILVVIFSTLGCFLCVLVWRATEP